MSHAWMPLYVDDYLADTGHLTALEHGAYMLMIMHYWQKGGLPEDERMIARVARLSADQWSESRDVLAMLFEDGWKHKRIEDELAKASEIIGKRKAAATAMHAKRNAGAEQVQSTCSDTRVPPSPTPVEEDANASSVRERDGQFAQIWAAYPRKTGKGEARAKFDKALKAVGFPALLAGVQRYAADRQGEDPQFTMQMSRWLHGQHWTDEPAQRPRSRAGPPKPMTIGEMFREDARQNGILNDQPPANPPGRMETSDRDREVSGAGDPRVIALTRNVLGGFR